MTKKSFTVIFYLLTFYCYAFSGTYWTVTQGPTTKILRTCFFVNSNTGWISGDSGIILRTTNAGNIWTVQNSNITNDIYDHFFINERLGWAVAWQLDYENNLYPGTIILKTTDGGNHWNNYLYPDTNYFYRTIYFLDSLRGFMGGIPYFLLYTSNAGADWSGLVSDSISTGGFPVKNISFLNNNTGYACGGLMDFGGLIWKTTNSGLNWKYTIIGPDAITDLHIQSDDTIFASSGDFKFGANYFKTDNAGLGWTNYNLGYFGIVTSLEFRTKSEGWMTIGYQQKFFLTTDRGANWVKLDLPDTSAIFDICFPDSLNGWAVGANGRILKYNYLTGYENNDIILNKTFELKQNFPNPFNPVTVISYNIPSDVKRQTSNVKLIVYDALGKEVRTLVNENQKPGRYSVTFDGLSFPSGIYFYEMISGDNRQVRKMLLLK